MAVVSSSASSTSSATVTLTKWWLKDPTDSSLNTVVYVNSPDIEFDERERQGQFDAIGRADPIVVAGVRQADRFRIELSFTSKADQDRFDALRDTQRTLLLQSPYGDQWYCRIGGDVRRTRVLNPQFSRERARVVVPVVETRRP